MDRQIGRATRRPVQGSKENKSPVRKNVIGTELLNRLAEWKKAKQNKKLEEQKQLRPVFRTGRVRPDDQVLKRSESVRNSKKLIEEKKPPRTSRYQVASRTDSGLQKLKLGPITTNFAVTSSRPFIFTGGNKGSTTACPDPATSGTGVKKSGQVSTVSQASDMKAFQAKQRNPLPPSSIERSPLTEQNVVRKPIRQEAISTRKRRAEEVEDFISMDQNSPAALSLGCTPSGKVRRLKSGTPAPVIRKSFELKRLKTTEEKVAALMNSPMVEFRRKGSGSVRNSEMKPMSPFVSPEKEQEEERRNSLSEMRVEIIEKLSADYTKSPHGNLAEGPPKLDPASARKLRRKSKQLEEHLVSESKSTGRDVISLSAQHFRGLLLDETSRLTDLRTTWDALYMDTEVPVHAQAEIAAVIGQTDLLFRHKFFFYETMITQHEGVGKCAGTALEGRLVTVEDLLGYWELISIEISNINDRYERLSKWKDYNWVGELHDFDKESKAKKPVRPARSKVVPKRKKAVKSNFAEFRAKLQQQKKPETAELPTRTRDLLTSDEDEEVAIEETDEPRLRSAMKSKQKEPKPVGAVRFAPDDNQHTPPVIPISNRRIPTPYHERRASRRSAGTPSNDFVFPTSEARRRSRTQSNAMPSPKTPPSSPNTILNRPKSGTPFPASSQYSGSHRRIADIRSSAGLTLRTAEARRKTKSYNSPQTGSKGQEGRTRQSSVRFADNSIPEADSESVQMPVTPYNQSSLVPMPRRSRTSASAPKQTKEAPRTEDRSNSGSRVRFDSTATSPPAGTDSAPVTPFNKSSLVPLPRQSRKSCSRGGSGEPFVQASPPPTTPPRLVDITPLRRSTRLGSRQHDEGNVGLL